MALSSLLQQAKLAAQIRYDPQAQALHELLLQSKEGYTLGVQGERGAARGISAAIRDASPAVQKIYATQGQTLKQNRALAQRYLTNLTSAAQPFAAAAATEHTGALDRLAADQSTATHELSQRKLEAASGRSFNIQNLRGNYLSDVEKIGTRLADLGATKGAYAADAYGKLLDAEAKNRLARATLKQTAYDNRQSRKIAQQNADANTKRANNAGRNGRKGKKGATANSPGGLLTPGANAKALGQIEKAKSYILDLRGHLKSKDIYKVLVQGHKTKDNTIPAFDPLYVQAAFDLVNQRSGSVLTRKTVHRLHHAGVTIGGRYPYAGKAGQRKTGGAIGKAGAGFGGF